MSARDASTIAENVAVVRRGYEAFNTADMDTLIELFDESASWHTPGRSRLCRRPEDARRPLPTSAGTWARRAAPSRPTLQPCPHRRGRPRGRHPTNTGERNGKQLDVDCCIVFELENGRITDGREHF